MDDEDRTVMPAGTPGTSLPQAEGGGGSGTGALGLRQVGRYQILERLGSGAMATVYRAHDPSIDRDIAIKFLHPALCIDPEYRMRFLREARAAGMLSHPNIVTIFDVGEIEGRPYIAMELLEGGPLDEGASIADQRPIPEVLDIGTQLANALDYAHAKGIFHRDIKPSNIVRPKGSSSIKLTDFGIAYVEAAGATRATRVGTMMGTPHYMSPEQAAGTQVDGRSDLFSVGVVLYQLLTGKRPFDGDSIVSIVTKVATAEPKPIGELRKNVPATLRRIIERCLSKRADRRFQSGAELSDALRKFARESQSNDVQKDVGSLESLRFKWTAIMALAVGVIMALASTFVIDRQYRAMMDQMVDHGASLSKLIATESAASALSDDWVAIDVFVQEVKRALALDSLSVIDYNGVVRVSTDTTLVDKPFTSASGGEIPSRDPAVTARRAWGTENQIVLDFEAPITFQGKQVGKVRLGLLEAPLAKVAKLSWLWMALLFVVTVGTVIVATYVMADRYARRLRLLREAMDEVGQGRLDYRIGERRNDEFGVVFRAFDRMAEGLDRSTANTLPPTTGPGHPASEAITPIPAPAP